MKNLRNETQLQFRMILKDTRGLLVSNLAAATIEKSKKKLIKY